MSYNITCLKCKTNFVSEDEGDADGEAYCPSCKEANKEIAKKVDEMIANRRASKQTANGVNVYHEMLKKPKGSVTYMNLNGR